MTLRTLEILYLAVQSLRWLKKHARTLHKWFNASRGISKCKLSITSRNEILFIESAFRAEGGFAKWPLRILGKNSFPYYSTIDRGVPEDVLFSMIRGGLYGCDNTAMIQQ